MKKIFIFSLLVFIFPLFFLKNVNAATTCVGTTNPDKCNTPKEQSNCCSGNICKAGVMGSQNTCVPTTCSKINEQAECPSGFTCKANSLGPPTCQFTATTCVGTTNPGTCTSPGQQAECCSGNICTKQSLGPNKCIFTATICTNGKDPNTCSKVGEQAECCSGNICTTNSLGPPTCEPSGQKADKSSPPCEPDSSGVYSCSTGFGIPISTNPQDFVTAMFQIILSISGGIALLLIIFSGYRMVMSQGNPEKIQEARDRLTSAIVGLLFIIFSLVILQIIGVDILHIPQFGY